MGPISFPVWPARKRRKNIWAGPFFGRLIRMVLPTNYRAEIKLAQIKPKGKWDRKGVGYQGWKKANFYRKMERKAPIWKNGANLWGLGPWKRFWPKLFGPPMEEDLTLKPGKEAKEGIVPKGFQGSRPKGRKSGNFQPTVQDESRRR